MHLTCETAMLDEMPYHLNTFAKYEILDINLYQTLMLEKSEKEKM